MSETAEVQTRRIEAALRIIEIYFRPWSAVKAAEWEEVSGGNSNKERVRARRLQPEVALRLIKQELCSEQ